MRALTWICAILMAVPLLAGERMTVSVCVRGSLEPKYAGQAEATAASLFHAGGIDIAWANCELAPEGDDAVQQHWFTLRLRDGEPFITPGPGAMDTLGEAFFSEDQAGYIADVYYQPVKEIADNREAEFPRLLGYVMAHELGHLLLGPAHAREGIMRADWDPRDLQAIRQGYLRFRPAEAARMRQVLQKTDIPGAPAP